MKQASENVAQKKSLITWAYFLLVLVSVPLAAFLYVIFFGQLRVDSKTDQEYVEAIVAACKDASHKPSCFDKEIPKITEKLSMEHTFSLIKEVVALEPQYAYCHVLGHEISARETKKDPSKWQEVVSRCPSGVCSNGCIHGAFQEKFRKEALPDAEITELTPELENICEKRDNWNPTGLEQSSCYHALGHLTMYVTAADVEKSIKLCEEIAQKPDGRDFTAVCFDGVFMQIHQPLEAEDFALIEGKQPTADEQPAYCAHRTGEEKTSCWIEGWPRFREKIVTPTGVVDFCSYLQENEGLSRCYNSLFFVVTPIMGFDVEKINTFCSGIPTGRRGQCFANAASRMIETDWRMVDQAISLCQKAAGSGSDTACFDELVNYSTFNFHAGSEAFLNLCNKLPEDWKKACLQNGGVFSSPYIP